MKSEKKPLVSSIIIFFNAEKFLEEAIQSILAQTYTSWELLLVDDGSIDGSTTIAQRYAAQNPNQIYYHDHPNHLNCGKGASRNLGINKAKGELIAFLDADDIWLPNKLEEQIAILQANPEVEMLYGDTLYWHSWTGNPEATQRDFIPRLGVESGKLIHPPMLLPLYLRGKAAVPCTCSILVKREIAKEVGGFEEDFRGVYNIYEDQAFYAKISLIASAQAINRCWDKYRQHSEASVAIAQITRQEDEARRFFLEWLGDYLTAKKIENKVVWEALQKEKWLKRHPGWLPDSIQAHNFIRWIKKWVLRIEEWIVPSTVRHWYWVRGN